ncbi:hypothetical protein Lser_V15G42182 [Lactuca serriola]
MSYEDRNGLPHSYGIGFHQSFKNGLPISSQGEIVFPSLGNDGAGHHLSSTPPPLPLVTLLTSHFPQVERYETTQALLSCRHQDVNFLCAHVLEMKLYIDKLDRMGVVFPRDQAIDLVLLLLPKSYDQFIENFYMRNIDVTLIDLTQMLMVAEPEMLKSTSKAKMLIGSNSKFSMDINNSENSGPEKISLPNGKGLAKVKLFDRMVKRKARFGIVPCVDPKESICFYCKLKGH